MADADHNQVHGGKTVRGATAERVTTAKANDRSTGLLDAFLAAGAELVQDGADGITTSCGFLSIYQRELAAHCRVPVAASALMQIPLVERLLPPRKRMARAALIGDRLHSFSRQRAVSAKSAVTSLPISFHCSMVRRIGC